MLRSRVSRAAEKPSERRPRSHSCAQYLLVGFFSVRALPPAAGDGQEFVEYGLADNTDQAVTGRDDDPDSGGALSAANEDAVAGRHDEGVDSHRNYSAADLEIVTLREAVARRPAMYFGDYTAEDWPLVIAAWTATDLLDYVVTPRSHAMITLHRNGDLSAAAPGARLTCRVTAQPRSADDVIRRRMWWHQLCSSMAVTVLRNVTPSGTADIIGDELVWNDLSIAVRLTLDADLVGVPSQMWWQDGAARLRAVFATDRFRLPPDRHLTVTDEAAGTVATID